MDKVHVSLGHEKQFTGKAREEDSEQLGAVKVKERICTVNRQLFYFLFSNIILLYLFCPVNKHAY